MTKGRSILRNSALTGGILVACFLLSEAMQLMPKSQDNIETIFVFAVFLISLLTDGYVYGIVATSIGVLAVNFTFRFPYFSFDFILPENILATIVMLVISLLTSTLTTRVKRWELLKKESEMETMRANLLRAVSHDLRTPLTTVYGSSSAILENYDAIPDGQKKVLIRGIQEDAQWLIRMVENLLSVTKLDGGSLKLIKTPVVLEELLESVISKFYKRYPQQKINFDLPEDMVIIPMDAILMEQVLINILENAVQHAKGMTELNLRVYCGGSKAVFEISDNGGGIDQERLPDLFSGRVSPEEALFDGKKRNAGIGLSVCASIIKAHGGQISAENQASGGALFRFALDIEEDGCEQPEV